MPVPVAYASNLPFQERKLEAYATSRELEAYATSCELEAYVTARKLEAYATSRRVLVRHLLQR